MALQINSVDAALNSSTGEESLGAASGIAASVARSRRQAGSNAIPDLTELVDAVLELNLGS